VTRTVSTTSQSSSLASRAVLVIVDVDLVVDAGVDLDGSEAAPRP